MTNNQVHIERRAAQRFEIQTPVTLYLVANATKGCGVTQDLSGRGLLLYTDMPLSEGDPIELTLEMPSEITLGENMRVRCKGKVLRVCGLGTKGGYAIHIEGAYEFLADEMKQFAETRTSGTSDHPQEAGMSANIFNQRDTMLY
ncbi:MAG TPA: PilZ domain-containing protein [Terriglobales bacterium]|nr:PilZ domain-containing protein [Terriglobales bacterium]